MLKRSAALKYLNATLDIGFLFFVLIIINFSIFFLGNEANSTG